MNGTATYPVVEFPPLAFTVVVVFSSSHIASGGIIVPALVGPGVFALVPFAVVGHGDGLKSSYNRAPIDQTPLFPDFIMAGGGPGGTFLRCEHVRRFFNIRKCVVHRTVKSGHLTNM